MAGGAWIEHMAHGSLALALSAFCALAQADTATEAPAHLVLYWAAWGSPAEAPVAINGRPVGVLARGAYLPLALMPGRYLVRIGHMQGELVSLSSGQTEFEEYGADSHALAAAGWLTSRPAGEATPRLAELNNRAGEEGVVIPYGVYPLSDEEVAAAGSEPGLPAPPAAAVPVRSAVPDRASAAPGKTATPAAPPVMPAGLARWAYYQGLASPKAFVVFESGAWRFWHGRPDAAQQAADLCARSQAPRCWLYAIDDRVVWQADVTRRIARREQLPPR
jgi:hypothetical protein